MFEWNFLTELPQHIIFSGKKNENILKHLNATLALIPINLVEGLEWCKL